MGKVYAILAAIAGFIAMVAAAFLKGSRAGKDAVRAEQLEEAFDAVEEKVDLERELDAPDERERLREKHYRD